MGIENVDELKGNGNESEPKEELGTIADGDDIPESEEEITQDESAIDPGEAIEVDDTEES